MQHLHVWNAPEKEGGHHAAAAAICVGAQTVRFITVHALQ